MGEPVNSGIPISIHAPREGSDIEQKINMALAYISIHAPREGSDLSDPTVPAPCYYFNPRSP